ncbi:MAG: penicillin-binding protein 1A [Parvularculales bacterium]
MRKFKLFLLGASTTLLSVVVVGSFLLFPPLWRLQAELPDYRHLANYTPSVSSRIHAGDGSLIGEYATEHRLFVPIEAIPKRVIQAFLATEDQRFYFHSGIDFMGLVRATFNNIFNVIQERRLEGASTITQQVAKNFLLSNEVTIERKVREMMLAYRLEQAFSKDEILELYLNEIYLGIGGYGVAAAALNYFNKSLDDLTIEETAYLAALPKAPNNYHPVYKPQAALGRRNWVIKRMVEEGYISEQKAQEVSQIPLKVTLRAAGVQVKGAEYFVEEVRRELLRYYGEDDLYEGGLSVRTTLDVSTQLMARRALRDGLVDYDRRHGWRGPLMQLESKRGVIVLDDWAMNLAHADLTPPIGKWRVAVVLDVSDNLALIGLQNGKEDSIDIVERGLVPFSSSKWARRVQREVKDEITGEITIQNAGDAPSSMKDVLTIGDVIFVEPKEHSNEFGAGSGLTPLGLYSLRQEPLVNGAILVMDLFTGRVLAMEGGFSYERSEFNRATQAWRQSGSAFKPFVYAAALDNGYTPVSIVLDAPFVIDQGAGLGFWKPHNYGDKFYGPSTLRTGIEKSRNVMTVRLVQEMGMEPVVDYAQRFGVMDRAMPLLSTALGAGETTLLRLTAAYGVIANGGRKITPVLIDRIQDRRGQSIYTSGYRECLDCNPPVWKSQPEPVVINSHRQVISPQTAYQITSMLEGVIERGTAQRVRDLGVPLAGKTGTTNEERDAWFVGFSPNVVVGIFVGYDKPTPLGDGETGSRVAAPIFRDFMKSFLADKKAIPFRIPPMVDLIRVDARTGKLARPSDTDVILESFKKGDSPTVAGNNQFYNEAFGEVPSETRRRYRAEFFSPETRAVNKEDNDSSDDPEFSVESQLTKQLPTLPILIPSEEGGTFSDDLY